MAKKENRKNYSIDPIKARELAHIAINMSNEIGKTVPKQEVLDTLIVLLGNPKIYKRVLILIKKIK